MKFLSIAVLALLAIKAFTFWGARHAAEQQIEIDIFIFNEMRRKWAELPPYKEVIEYSYKNSNIPTTIAPKDSLKEGRSVYPFNSFHEYLTFVIQKNPDLGLDTIESIDHFPDSLENLAREDNAIKSLLRLYKSNNWTTQYQEGKLKGIIHDILKADSLLEIELDPFYSFISMDPFYITVESSKDTFRTIPFYYKGDIRKLNFITTNPVTNEVVVIRNR